MILPEEKQGSLDRILAGLQNIPNVKAVVLGGSHAAGAATPSSDLDIGIYYEEQSPFDINAIRALAHELDLTGHPTVTGFYGWGPWVNGGAWIETAGGKVDFLYRNISQVLATIEKAIKGEWQSDFEQQPPYGFSSPIYLGETEICLPLFDPAGIIAHLKSLVRPYPPALKEAVIRQSLWGAEFTIWHAEYFLEKNDIYNLAGCLTRAARDITRALFAINEIYPTGDKRSMEMLECTDKHPAMLTEKMVRILSGDSIPAGDRVFLLKSVLTETIEISAGTYQPLFSLKKH
jgi:predicted nucleotidyltransferase